MKSAKNMKRVRGFLDYDSEKIMHTTRYDPEVFEVLSNDSIDNFRSVSATVNWIVKKHYGAK